MMMHRAQQAFASLLLISLMLFAIGVMTSAHAQMPPMPASSAEEEALPVLDKTLTEAEFQALLGTLTDAQVRDVLIAQYAELRGEEEAAARPSLLETLRTMGKQLTANVQTIFGKWEGMGTGFRAINDGLAEAGGLTFGLLAFAICAGGGFVVRFFWRRKAAQRQLKLAERNAGKGPYADLAIICDAGLFLIIDLSSALAFAVTAHAVLYIFFDTPNLHLFVSGYITVITVFMVVRSVLELIFPTNWPVYRMVAISDRATRILHITVLWLATLWMVELTTAHMMARFGAPEGTPILFSLTCSILWLLSALVGIATLHRATSDLLPTREQDSGITAAFTRAWPTLTTIFVLFTWSMFAGSGLISGNIDFVAGAIFQMTLLMFGFWFIYRVLVLNLRAKPITHDMAAAIAQAARAALLAVGLILALSIWGVNPENLGDAGVAGSIFKAIINVFLTVLIGWAIWDFVRTIIDARIAAESPQQDDEEPAEGEGGLGASRTATLLPLLRSSALGIIGLTGLFTAASSLGVNVAPLIAGAGVVGLAIGFGAQTLVKDIVSGVFFLIDDAFRRGEYIDLGSVKGTVERISVRSLQLRHHLGAVHTIPFGEITALTNYSRDWVIMKLPLRLTFDTDPTKVKKLIKRIGAEFMENEDIGKGLLEPPKSQGVIQMEDSAMILRVKFKAVPGKQFVIRRELLHRIRAVFEEEGIRFANREVTVRVNEGASDAEKREAAGAAAMRSVEQAEQPVPGT